jgi:hypothetical protein
MASGRGGIAVAGGGGGGGGGPQPLSGYGPIGGALGFQGGGGDYKSAYAASLAMNQQNYNNILAGYQNTMTAQQNAQGRINTGYQNLQSNVLGSIAGIDRSQRQDIADQYAKNIGMASQDLINRGLGNSTVQSSVGRGLLYDKSKADIALTNSTQGLNAQYMSNLGLAGLNFQGQAMNANTAWAGKQLDFMNSVQAGYPDPRTYAMLAQMKGQSGIGGGGAGGGVAAPGGGFKAPVGPGGSGYYGGGYGGGFGAARPSSTPYSGAPESIYPSGNYPLDPADPFYSTQEGQAVGGGTMGVNEVPWWAEQDQQMAGVQDAWQGQDYSGIGGDF